MGYHCHVALCQMGSDKLRIDYDLYDTHYGSLLIASTHVGVCYSTFCTSAEAALDILRLTFGQAQIFRATAQWHRRLLSCLKPSDSADDCISLHLMGSEFRLKVWRALLEVPLGSVATYSDLAQAIGSPKAVRAVGSAVASNPIVPFIPCHRIIRRDGSLGNYSAEGGTERKAALLFMEQAILPSI